MENFGAAFDDDFFETNTKNTKKSSESFNTKLYDPLWFKQASDDENDEGVRYRLECLANWHYRQKNFERALEVFMQAAEQPKAQIREINEAIVRCHTHLNHRTQAFVALGVMEKEARSLDQVTAFLNLSAFVYRQFGMLQELVLTLQKLCIVHSFEPTLWYNLADTYRTLISLKSKNESSTLNDRKALKLETCKNMTNGSIEDHPMERSMCTRTENPDCSDGNKSKENANKETSGNFKEQSCKAAPQSESSVISSSLNNLTIDSKNECEESESSGRGVSDQEYSSTYSLRCNQLTCLNRTSVLLKIYERHLLGFAADKNKILQEKVNEQIDALPLSHETKKLCVEGVDTASRESEGERDDKQILIMLTNAKHVFEEKWYSWIPKGNLS